MSNRVDDNLKYSCPECAGVKTASGYACPGFRPITLTCSTCNGIGSIPQAQQEAIEMGKAIRARRFERYESMTEAAKRLNMDIGAYSDLEHGRR